MVKIIYHWKEIIQKEIETKIKLLAFILFYFFMYINVNVTNTFYFFHHITQYLSYLNMLDYHSDYTSIKYEHLEKRSTNRALVLE